MSISTPEEIMIITAGGAGMFCGSCMQDNTLAKAMIQLGKDVTLLPLYTPIRVDEPSLAEEKVFFGGLNIYFNQNIPLWSKLPRFMTKWLDHPQMIRWATSFGISNEAKELGKLTISMLHGNTGPHLTQIKELVHYLTISHHPRSIIFSNVLISGIAPELRKTYRGHLAAIIQGDDLFLDQLSEEHKRRSIELIHNNVAEFDCFYTHSEFYGDYMSDYLGLPKDKFVTIPLGLELDSTPKRVSLPDAPWTIGYFARIAPEKGFLELVQAFKKFQQLVPKAKLRVGGYLAKSQQKYYEQAISQLEGSQPSFTYIGSPNTAAEKADFYRSIDVLTVPVQFHEPKGIYALEAMSHGVPVVLPDRGALPEIVQRTSGGFIYEHQTQAELLHHWGELAQNRDLYQKLSQSAYDNVRKLHLIHATARAIMKTIPH